MPKRESAPTRKRRERVAVILPVLQKLYPDAKCSLDFSSPLELLVATILSAQCTDERVNLTTPALFRKHPDAEAYANTESAKLESLIISCGFYRNKAKSIRGAGQALVARHEGEVPRTMEELVDLPGVGRKTANVILGNAFGINVGVTVDTHVGRLSRRLGLTKHEDPVKVEQDLMPIVPQEEWCQWSHLLIAHGRRICVARSPKCEVCVLLSDCPTGPKILREREAARPKGRSRGR